MKFPELKFCQSSDETISMETPKKTAGFQGVGGLSLLILLGVGMAGFWLSRSAHAPGEGRGVASLRAGATSQGPEGVPGAERKLIDSRDSGGFGAKNGGPDAFDTGLRPRGKFAD